MKETYEKIEIAVVCFQAEDIIMTSPAQGEKGLQTREIEIVGG